MLSVNKVILVGNVGQDPKLLQMKNGRHSLNLSIATSTRWKNKDGKFEEKTDWHKVCIFGEALVDNLKNKVKKGTPLYVEGKISTRSWKSDNGLSTNYITEVVVSDRGHSVILLEKNAKSPEGNYNYTSLEKNYNRKQTDDLSSDDFDDSIPF